MFNLFCCFFISRPSRLTARFTRHLTSFSGINLCSSAFMGALAVWFNIFLMTIDWIKPVYALVIFINYVLIDSELAWTKTTL